MIRSINLTKWGPATVLVVALVIIFVVAAVVCLVIGGDTYARFLQLANTAWKFAVASGLLGLGRGVHQGLTNLGAAQIPVANADAVPRPESSAATPAHKGPDPE